MAQDIDEQEIDLLELAGKLWAARKFIGKCCIIGAIVGLIVAFSIPKEYTTTVIFTTDLRKPPGGSMGALASMAGINLSSGSLGDETLSPELYPDILNSTPFVQDLLDIRVQDLSQNIDTTLYNYLSEGQKKAWWGYVFGLPGMLIKAISSDDDDASSDLPSKYFISKENMAIIESFKSSYSIVTDKKTGVSTVEVTSQSPSISAFLADTLTNYLQTYIIDHRTKKAKTDLTNSVKLYEQAKNDYYVAQQKLASFTDGNTNVVLAKYRINQERLQNEANIAYSGYNQMAQQVQVDKIKIQNDTPVFTVIQPAVEPLFAEKPKRKLIIIAMVFLAVVGACGWVLGKDYLSTIK